MEGTYSIQRGGQIVGTAKISREGLYYQFDCQCQLDKKEVCKICISCGEEQTILGTPIPEGRMFKLRTKLPTKRFAGKEPSFTIISNNEEISEEFIEIKTNMPFPHLVDLKNAVYKERNGASGVVIRK